MHCCYIISRTCTNTLPGTKWQIQLWRTWQPSLLWHPWIEEATSLCWWQSLLVSLDVFKGKHVVKGQLMSYKCHKESQYKEQALWGANWPRQEHLIISPLLQLGFHQLFHFGILGSSSWTRSSILICLWKLYIDFILFFQSNHQLLVHQTFNWNHFFPKQNIIINNACDDAYDPSKILL